MKRRHRIRALHWHGASDWIVPNSSDLASGYLDATGRFFVYKLGASWNLYDHGGAGDVVAKIATKRDAQDVAEHRFAKPLEQPAQADHGSSSCALAGGAGERLAVELEQLRLQVGALTHELAAIRALIAGGEIPLAR